MPLAHKPSTQSSQRVRQEAMPGECTFKESWTLLIFRVDDPWAEPAPVMPTMGALKPKQATSSASKPLRPKQVIAAPAPSTSNEWGATQMSDWQDNAPQVAADDKPSPPVNISLAGLSKEEKEKEMARRREERKAVS